MREFRMKIDFKEILLFCLIWQTGFLCLVLVYQNVMECQILNWHERMLYVYLCHLICDKYCKMGVLKYCFCRDCAGYVFGLHG